MRLPGDYLHLLDSAVGKVWCRGFQLITGEERQDDRDLQVTTEPAETTCEYCLAAYRRPLPTPEELAKLEEWRARRLKARQLLPSAPDGSAA